MPRFNNYDEKTFKEIKKIETQVKNVVLNGNEENGFVLRVEKVEVAQKITYEIDSETKKSKLADKKILSEKRLEPREFSLSEVSVDELLVLRKSEEPGFVFKIGNRLYYTAIDDINLISFDIRGKHACAPMNTVCHRLSAATDEEGGCRKVRERSKRIEKYDFIVEGYETFNVKMPCFHVIKCSNYEKCPPREHMSVMETNRARLALVQNIWPDVDSLSEAKERMKVK